MLAARVGTSMLRAAALMRPALLTSCLELRASSSEGTSTVLQAFFSTQRERPDSARTGGDARQKKARGGAEGDATPKQQQVITLLIPPDQQQGGGGAPARQNYAEHTRREREYQAGRAQQRSAWQEGMQAKHKLQQAAVRALPDELKAKARQLDSEVFPPNRQYLFETPPEAYRDTPKK